MPSKVKEQPPLTLLEALEIIDCESLEELIVRHFLYNKEPVGKKMTKGDIYLLCLGIILGRGIDISRETRVSFFAEVEHAIGRLEGPILARRFNWSSHKYYFSAPGIGPNRLYEIVCLKEN